MILQRIVEQPFDTTSLPWNPGCRSRSEGKSTSRTILVPWPHLLTQIAIPSDQWAQLVANLVSLWWESKWQCKYNGWVVAKIKHVGTAIDLVHSSSCSRSSLFAHCQKHNTNCSATSSQVGDNPFPICYRSVNCQGARGTSSPPSWRFSSFILELTDMLNLLIE